MVLLRNFGLSTGSDQCTENKCTLMTSAHYASAVCSVQWSLHIAHQSLTLHSEDQYTKKDPCRIIYVEE